MGSMDEGQEGGKISGAVALLHKPHPIHTYSENVANVRKPHLAWSIYKGG